MLAGVDSELPALRVAYGVLFSLDSRSAEVLSPRKRHHLLLALVSNIVLLSLSYLDSSNG